MKYQKIIITLVSALMLSLLVGVPTAHAGEACRDVTEFLHIDGFVECGTEDVVSFIGFEGGLQAPTGEGLDPTLTRAKTAREFIVNTVNFALSFLGVLAVVIVIYGGFLYVTAAGNEEQSGKGKKAITYAGIGILIIIASFAFVNTLLTFGGGSGNDRTAGTGTGDNTRGVGQEGNNLGQQVVYNLGAAEINSSLNDFIGAYKNLVTIKGFITKINAVSDPDSREENRDYLNQITSIVTEIKNSSNSLSKVHQVAQSMLDNYLFGLRDKSANDLVSEKYEIKSGKSLLAKEVREKLQSEFLFEEAASQDYNSAISALIGSSPNAITTRPAATATVDGRLPVVWKIMGEVSDSTGVQNAINRGLITEKELSRAFAGIDPNITVGELFKNAITKLHEARSLSQNSNETEKLVAAVKSLNQLYIIVKDIQFVYVRIRASAREGSAPFIVELNGLDSRDPAAQTIPEENYQWDPDGNGKADTQTAAVQCTGKDAKGPTITCTYTQPGTYLVRLSIKSKDEFHIAAGQALLAITVQPPTSRISLKASVGEGISSDLRKYQPDSSGKWFVQLDQSEFQVTTREAKEVGVKFDASETKGGDGQPVEFYQWSFGDAKQPEEGVEKNTVTHKYEREGQFPLKLEVTDRGKRKDRKMVNIIIASIAARIGLDQDTGEPDQVIEFDGSLSKSDRGSVKSYSWSIAEKNGTDITNLDSAVEIIGDPENSVLRTKFKKPGTYTVKLTVSDGSQTATKELTVNIKSRKPRANILVRACPENCADASQPSLVEFDASNSYDPDKEDTLTYDWHFYNELGEELKSPIGLTLLDNVTFPSQTAKKLRVKFLKRGIYKVVLNVNDSHEDAIRQEDTKEKTVKVESLVEARWAENTKPYAKLDSTRTPPSATVKLRGQVVNAQSIHVEFGDGQSLDQSVSPMISGSQILPDSAVGLFEMDHEYMSASPPGGYLVSVRAVSDENEGDNIITKRIFVTGGDVPVALIEVTQDDAPVVLPDEVQGQPKTSVQVIRNKLLKFSASHSVNSTGTETGLKYSWAFGDGALSTGATVEHAFAEISPEEKPFVVTLTVTEAANPTKFAATTFPIEVISKKPIVNTLSLERKTAQQATPIDVQLTAEGGVDPDGRITNYKFWYYDPAEKDHQLSVIDTPNNHATLTLETAGEEGQEHEYVFCVSATDNENFTSSCDELFNENELPKLRVKNGPNKSPVASFTVDRSNIKVGEGISFTSNSTDPDGRIVKYVWDFDGDGFQNDNPTELATTSHTYDHKSPLSGYRVKLKVIDNQNAAGYSREIPIHVEPKSQAPVANFTYITQGNSKTVKFNSEASTSDMSSGARIVKWKWDFDTSTEITCNRGTLPKPDYCNGDNGDDSDSTDQNPIFSFPTSQNYFVKLIVEDSDGNFSDPKTVQISLIAGSSGGVGTTPPQLEAVLKTDPPSKFENVLEGGNYVQKKVIHMPAGSAGEPVTLFWGDSTGDIIEYKIDKNTYCDSDANGSRGDDTDHIFPDSSNPNSNRCTDPTTGMPAEGCWTAPYQRTARTDFNKLGHFNTRLTVTDRNGSTTSDVVEIIFDGQVDRSAVEKNKCDGTPQESNYKASLLKQIGPENAILLGLVGGVIVALMGFAIGSFMTKGKRRV
ncbi:MAG: PKD domain-containing protein [Patescibacteria group bacterium]